MDPVSTLRGVSSETCTRTVDQKVQFVFVSGCPCILLRMYATYIQIVCEYKPYHFQLLLECYMWYAATTYRGKDATLYIECMHFCTTETCKYIIAL